MIKYPVSTEKAIKMMEMENALVFVVDRRARKPEIKKAIESQFNIIITSIRTLVDRNGEKRAIVRLSPETPAIDVATNLGLM